MAGTKRIRECMIEYREKYLKKFVQGFSIIKDIRLMKTKIKYQKQKRIISTGYISNTSSLGIGVRLDEDVKVMDQCSIGDWTYMRCGSILWHKSSIGKYCSIGDGCLIGVPKHPVHFLSTSPYIYHHPRYGGVYWPINDIIEPAIIENDVWLGSNVIIMQGCKIGNGAIVGAGAIVTHDVEPYSIVAGIPAHMIGQRFSEEIIDILNNSRWWDYNSKKIDECLDYFFDINKFVKYLEDNNEDSGIHSS